ncbi:MAG TPA: TatD family hydrolase [Sphaerochaeta sp.]|nr:TatD family hydrolase [Sphaerochaeta sp.]
MRTETPYIDTHFHLLGIEAKGIDVPALLAEMQSEELRGIDIGLSAADLGERVARFGKTPGIHFAAGLGPWGVREGNAPISEQLAALVSEIEAFRPVAIGEIGLDNYRAHGTVAEQEHLLGVQLEIADFHRLPVIFHNRDADEQFITLLKERSFAQRGIFHCYHGGEELAALAVQKGFFLSFAGTLTYKANTALQQLFSTIPIEAILLETDSPYLAPVPLRGKINTPISMEHIYRFAAGLRRMDLQEFAAQIAKNYAAFISQ